KEKLTQRELHSVDNSLTRDFVRREIMSDLSPATQPVSPVDPKPTTTPVAEAPPTTMPTTQPVVEAPVATTQPVADAAPATQPSVDADKVIADAVMAAPPTQPATQPAAQTTVSVVEIKEETAAVPA